MHYPPELEQIREILRQNPQGMSITEIAAAIGKNKHSSGRYLDILRASGEVELRHYGMAKVFSLARRVPVGSLISYASDLILVLDKDLRIVQANDPVLALLRTTRDEIVGKNLPFIAPGSPALQDLVEALARGAQVMAADREIQIKEEPGTWFRMKCIPTLFEDGREGITVILEDITARKQAERALEEREALLRGMAENIRDGLLISENDQVIYANPRLGEILGYPLPDLLRMKPADLAAPGDKERFKKVMEEYRRTGVVPEDIRFWFCRKDGTWRYLYARLSDQKIGDTVRRFIVVTDMTSWKEQEAAVDMHVTLTRHLIDVFRRPIYYIDRDRVFQGANISFAEFIGVRREDIIGSQVDEVVPLPLREIISHRDAELLSQAGYTSYHAGIDRPEGRIDIIVEKASFRSPEGDAAWLVGTITLPEPSRPD